MEEEKFLVLLDRGIKILDEEISYIDKVLTKSIYNVNKDKDR